MEEYIRQKCVEKNVYPTLYVSKIALGWLEENIKTMGLQIDEIEDTLIEDNNWETVEILIVNLKYQSNPSVQVVFDEFKDVFSKRRIFIADNPLALNENLMTKQDNITTLRRISTDHYYLMDNGHLKTTTTLNIGFAYPWHQSWCGKYGCPPSNLAEKLYRDQFEGFDLADLCLIKLSMRCAKVNRKPYKIIRDIIKRRMDDTKEKLTVNTIPDCFYKQDFALNVLLIYYLMSNFNYRFIYNNLPGGNILPSLWFHDLVRIRMEHMNKPYNVRTRNQRDYSSISYFSNEFNPISTSDKSANIMKCYSDRQKLEYLTPKQTAYIEISWKSRNSGVHIKLANLVIDNWNFMSQYLVRQITLKNVQFTRENLMNLAKLNFNRYPYYIQVISSKILVFNDCPDLNDMMLLNFIESMDHDTGFARIAVCGTTLITKLFHYTRAESKIGENPYYLSLQNLPLVYIETLEHMTAGIFFKSVGKLVCQSDPELID